MTDRELDALVAEKVMGWTSVEFDPGNSRLAGVCHGMPPCGRDAALKDLKLMDKGTGTGFFHIPRYSTTGEGMLVVIEALVERGWSVRMDTGDFGADAHVYRNGEERFYERGPHASDDSLPRAVALAALKALGVN